LPTSATITVSAAIRDVPDSGTIDGGDVGQGGELGGEK